MKKIVNGKRYNTETATEIADWDNGLPKSDFRYCVETLYITPRGNFFLHGRGGAMTKYRENAGGDCWSGGSDIVPMTRAEAVAWCERREQVDALEEHFGSEIQDA